MASDDRLVIWSAGMEDGTLAEWREPSRGDDTDGGGLFNSGTHEALVSGEQARSGASSLRARIWQTADEAPGVRAFRWLEARQHRELYYSAWFFITEEYRPTEDRSTGGFWNMFQFKSRSADGRNDPLWALYVHERPDGAQYLRAGWGWGGTEVAGPFAESPLGGRFFDQWVADLPIGRWFHVEAFLRQSKDFDGRLTVWQDGVELYDFANVRTSYAHAGHGQSWGANNEWSVNNYSDGLSPSPATVYIDDAEIRR